MASRARAFLVVGGIVAALGLGTVFFLTRDGSGGRRGSSDQPAPQVFDAAPRECPAPRIRGPIVDRRDIDDLMHSHLPSSLPNGFGVQAAWEERDTNLVVWVDGRCREILLVFVEVNPSSPPAGPRVGPWVMTSNVPNGCGNEVLETSRCLTYAAAAPDGDLGLQLVGFEVDEGNAIARSIHVS